MWLEILVEINNLRRKGADAVELMNFIRALPETRPIAREILTILIDGLKDENWMVRCWAAEELGKLGSEAMDALPALEKALKDEQYFVTIQVKTAIQKISGTVEK